LVVETFTEEREIIYVIGDVLKVIGCKDYFWYIFSSHTVPKTSII